jgi:SAM-dependent methyltransferase
MTVETPLLAPSPPRVQDGIASVFDRASGYYRTLRWEQNRLTRFEKSLTEQTLRLALGTTEVESALEIGCGPGTWTGLLAERAQRVLALDLSEGMLELAGEAWRGHDRIRFQQGDAARFSTDQAFDLVMSVRVLEYVPEWRDVVGRFADLVKPGGHAVVITKTPLSVWRGTGRERWFGPHTMARRLRGRQLDPEFWQRHIRVRDMRAAFAAAGFTDLQVHPVIVGLPVFVRGTKQYPLVPEFAEPPLLRAGQALWDWASRGGPARRIATLPLSESYAVWGRRR